MTEPIFFELPIYRCSRTIHTAEMDVLKAKWTVEEYRESLPESYRSHIQYYEQHLWYPWRYNEVIGYVNLYIMGSQLRADEWSVIKKRINKGIVKKDFRYRGKVLEKAIARNETSETLFAFVLESLELLGKKEYPKRYLDLTTFKITGRFIDWKKLTAELNSYTHPDIRKEYFESLK